MFIVPARLLLLIQLSAYNCLGVVKSKKEYINHFDFTFLTKPNNFVNSRKLQHRPKCYSSSTSLNGCQSIRDLERINLLAIKPINLVKIGKGTLSPISRIASRSNAIYHYIHNYSNNNILVSTSNVRNLSYNSKINLKNIKENYFKQQYQHFKTYSKEELNQEIVENSRKDQKGKMVFKKGRGIMSYFKNRQGLKIRTYASEVDNAIGKVFLVHGIRSHFRGDFCGYNIDWYYNQIGENVTESAHQTKEMEKRMVFPSKHQSRLLKEEENYSKLDGKDVFDVTPRFIYEGTFVEYLNNLGYSTYGLDHQSHGMSESVTDKRCYFENFDDVCYDLLQFITLVKKGNFHDTNQTYKPEEIFENEKEDKDFTTSNLYGSKNMGFNKQDKYYLMGLSMGGNVVLRSMELYSMKMGKDKKLVDALVCFAGMINLDYHFTGFLNKCLPFLKFVSKITPFTKAGAPYDPAYSLTTYLRHHDPLCFTEKLFLKMILMIYNATKVLDRDFEYYPRNLPTLFIHTEHDPMCDVKGPRYLMSRYFKGVDHVKFHELEGDVHVVTSPLLTTVTGPLVDKFLQDLQAKSGSSDDF